MLTIGSMFDTGPNKRLFQSSQVIKCNETTAGGGVGQQEVLRNGHAGYEPKNRTN